MLQQRRSIGLAYLIKVSPVIRDRGYFVYGLSFRITTFAPVRNLGRL
jgi:hypothetical protein